MVEFDHFKSEAGLHTFILSVSEWIEKTEAIGLFVKHQFHIMMSLLDEGAITMDDLDNFSDDLKDTIGHFTGK